MVMYADDTTLYYDLRDLSEDRINTELTKVSEWLAANKLSLNIKKTKYMDILPPHEGVDLNTSQNYNHNKGDPEVSCKLDQVDVSGKDPQMINTDTPEESTDGNPATGNRGTSHVKTRLRPAG